MKLLLTSNGLINDSITSTLQELLGKPFNEATVVFIPTAAAVERGDKKWLARDYNNVAKLGWKKFDIIDLAAVATLDKSLWWSAVEDADVLIIGGGNTFFLCYWLWQSGLADKLPELLAKKVYVGISAGSMAVTDGLRLTSHALDKFGTKVPYDEEYDELGPARQSSAKTLKLVPFVIRPHFGAASRTRITSEFIKEISKQLHVPVYAIDDNTAIRVVDGDIQVISEGKWELFNAE